MPVQQENEVYTSPYGSLMNHTSQAGNNMHLNDITVRTLFIVATSKLCAEAQVLQKPSIGSSQLQLSAS